MRCAAKDIKEFVEAVILVVRPDGVERSPYVSQEAHCIVAYRMLHPQSLGNEFSIISTSSPRPNKINTLRMFYYRHYKYFVLLL